jgi:hypothetical protein
VKVNQVILNDYLKLFARALSLAVSHTCFSRVIIFSNPHFQKVTNEVGGRMNVVGCLVK